MNNLEDTYYGRDGYKASVQNQNMKAINPAQFNVGPVNASTVGYITLPEIKSLK